MEVMEVDVLYAPATAIELMARPSDRWAAQALTCLAASQHIHEGCLASTRDSLQTADCT